MCKFITRKYEEKINNLESQIKNMTWEWNKEKELYDDEMRKKFYEQKVDFVIERIDIKQHKEIHRPIYGLTKLDDIRIAHMVKHYLEEQDILSYTSYHWREKEKCFVIDVQVITMKSEFES